jgi:hypothetical protein
MSVLSDYECILFLDAAVTRQSSTNIPSSGYYLESLHQATRALPSSGLLSLDECSLCLDSAVARHLLRTSRALNIASSRRIKLHEDFLLPTYLHRLSAASVLIQLWLDDPVRTSRALDTASRRRIKLQVLFLRRIVF